METVILAKEAGLKVCCGGILGMGETWQDRIDMALTLSEIGVDSIPINILMSAKGTPFEEIPCLSEEDILRSLCIFQIINPQTSIRMAAGRALMSEGGKKIFLAGIDSALTGDMLTTAGTSMAEDIAMLHSLSLC